MRVVAIDPAPAKESTMYSAEGGFRSVPASEMRGVLEDLASPVLLCWDAPLTGPRSVEEAGSGDGDFSQRRLDSFFARKETGFKTPKGISVLPYAGCPHWTISRSVLGLPRVGPWDADFDRLPFHLLPGNAREASGVAVSQLTRSCAVEIHPAVAAWLWCKKELRKRSWKRGKHAPPLRDHPLLTVDETQRRAAAAARLSAPINIDFVVRDGRVTWLREGMSYAQKIQSITSTVFSQGMRAVWDLGLGATPATDATFKIKAWRLVWVAAVSYEAEPVSNFV